MPGDFGTGGYRRQRREKDLVGATGIEPVTPTMST